MQYVDYMNECINEWSIVATGVCTAFSQIQLLYCTVHMINHNNLQSLSRLKELQYFNDLIINIFIR